jgi:hypothetical protein
MTAGNASNTVFTAIPVGEDFYMSFSTERFFHNIAPIDISNIVFKLYDARVIGSVGNPNPNAIIETVDKSVSPSRFVVGDKSISVLVLSATLDTWEQTKTSNNQAKFRGELYGFAELAVVGEEAGDVIRLTANPISLRLKFSASLMLHELWWDGYFTSADIVPSSCKFAVQVVGNNTTTGFVTI